jgi:lysyl-tRNA synthetase class 2
MKAENRTEQKIVELNDNEKLIFDILSKEKVMELGKLKTQSNLSNKAWDKSIKSLRKNEMIGISKTDDILMIEVVE